MAQAAHRPKVTLNTDGRAHPRENTLAVVSLALGVIALICGAIESTHVIGAWTGAAGLVIGFVSQMMSVTTAQRSLSVVGVVLAFTGALLAVANGGFV